MRKLVVLLIFWVPKFVSAHENYVLPKKDIDQGMMDWSLNVFKALQNSQNLRIALLVGLGSIIAVGLYYLFMVSGLGRALDQKLSRLEPFGHVILRIALAASFLTSTYFHSFLGPEIPLSSLPSGELLQPILYVVGILLLFGLFTEIVSFIGILILILATFVYKDYMFTYFNYFGELIVLVWFGSRIFSVDNMRRKLSVLAEKYKEFEIPIIRITYGISVLYPAITIKFLHPIIMVQIAEKYNLAQFHWLFPADPLLISLGTGAAQVMVGLAIIFGFQTRLNSAITFCLYVMSIMFFKEAVWPHYILLALAFYLTINDGGGYSIDRLILKKNDR